MRMLDAMPLTYFCSFFRGINTVSDSVDLTIPSAFTTVGAVTYVRREFWAVSVARSSG
jgi:hypothetical protein